MTVDETPRRSRAAPAAGGGRRRDGGRHGGMAAGHPGVRCGPADPGRSTRASRPSRWDPGPVLLVSLLSGLAGWGRTGPAGASDRGARPAGLDPAGRGGAVVVAGRSAVGHRHHRRQPGDPGGAAPARRRGADRRSSVVGEPKPDQTRPEGTYERVLRGRARLTYARPQAGPAGYPHRRGLPAPGAAGLKLQRGESTPSTSVGATSLRPRSLRNVKANPKVAFVVDDVLPPWQPAA